MPLTHYRTLVCIAQVRSRLKMPLGVALLDEICGQFAFYRDLEHFGKKNYTESPNVTTAPSREKLTRQIDHAQSNALTIVGANHKERACYFS
jgi:hypothetical protein